MTNFNESRSWWELSIAITEDAGQNDGNIKYPTCHVVLYQNRIPWFRGRTLVE